ncbi:F-box/WD repeat-containing protein 8 [Anguilla rostrata]|uniref:F-box/WD repeat-containing protein 8 n=1 Tax=Anguilla rostrata TaxID=7938 RepID=UPI0030D5F772
MEGDELHTFREQWEKELKKTTKNARKNVTKSTHFTSTNEDTKNRYFVDHQKESVHTRNQNKCVSEPQESSSNQSSREETEWEASSDPTSVKSATDQRDANYQPEYVSIAEGLLDGRTSPLRDRIQAERQRGKRQFDVGANVNHSRAIQKQPQCKVARGDAFVEQLIQDLNEINDIPFFDVELPYELALKIFQYLSRAELGRCAQVSKAWKVLAEDELLWYGLCLKEGYHSDSGVSDSPCWKSTLRDCLENERDLRYNWKVWHSYHAQTSCAQYVIAGYTSGDVRLWDTLHWDSGASYLRPTHLAMGVATRPHVSQVSVNETVAAAAYDDGESEISDGHRDRPSTGLPERIAATLACPVEKGYWRTLCQAELPKPVESLLLVPEKRGAPLAAASAGDTVYLLRPERDPGILHSVYGHPVTCLDADPSRAALGVKSSGWAMHDGGNKIHVYSLETGQPEASVGNSAGDFTCVNLRDSPAHLLVCGNKDRRVRVFDLRCGGGSPVTSLYAHHLGVTAVQADDWKVVSGGGEGLVCVWEMRTGAKLWESHNRHPVRHVHFGPRTLVTANVPDEKSPRGACITDDDLTAHRRHRGVICLYDFSVDTSAADHVLPICRSGYVESSGYNYNIGLAMPYDALAGVQAPV